MANADTPFGLKPVRHRNGAPYNGAFRVYSVAAGNATAIFVGDLVTGAGTAQTIDGVVYSDVVQSATGDIFQGVVVGVLPVTQDSLKYRAASTQRLLAVADDPDLLFEIQEVSGGTPLAANDIGFNANVVVGSGSTVTGLSGMELNNATEATTNTLDVKIVGLVNRADNEVGEHAKWLVALNRHRFANQVAGV
ncbi:hypothetical protein [Phenylobacterium sp. J367]|uniref:hypothetical protein n=1 Tax=Phenylobacterium sp. J367 TaxID=2898435 RepID=UPI0021515C31|nr:hypothetical protein [Phenylobacterium sp. J367]MCR5876938.1 hypothetical protein [Phenylobacterium sp. J367]MCR5877005.1 hypothetical protein [Phenylobacterium sp. J367]